MPHVSTLIHIIIVNNKIIIIIAYCWTEVNILTFSAYYIKCLKPKMHTKTKYFLRELIFKFLNRLQIKYIS